MLIFVWPHMHQAYEGLQQRAGIFAGIIEGKLYGLRYRFQLHITYPASHLIHTFIHCTWQLFAGQFFFFYKQRTFKIKQINIYLFVWLHGTQDVLVAAYGIYSSQNEL